VLNWTALVLVIYAVQ